MDFKYLFFIVLNTILIQSGTFENSGEMENIYLHLLGQMEKSLESVNIRLDILSDRYFYNLDKNATQHEKIVKKRPIFDIRYDVMPKHCATELPSTCAGACECTHSSGIYNITDSRYTNNILTVYCDCTNFDGDWLYILKRIDGSETFERPWSDYVKGFGNVAGEFWIGLENLYALTNFYGPQELNVYLENFEGLNVFARYDNFIVGSADEKYQLKSLGRYWGTAGDSFYNQLGMNFSTFDNDNDATTTRNCALDRKGGFWFNDCTIINPTGHYLRGNYSGKYVGSFWKSFESSHYSQKTIIFMIRRKNAEILE